MLSRKPPVGHPRSEQRLLGSPPKKFKPVGRKLVTGDAKSGLAHKAESKRKKNWLEDPSV